MTSNPPLMNQHIMPGEIHLYYGIIKKSANPNLDKDDKGVFCMSKIRILISQAGGNFDIGVCLSFSICSQSASFMPLYNRQRFITLITDE